ncbi:type I-D CRISPR-associated protein Cas7/Csc2 [Marininema halotolerans]|uniref:CRISPR-associated protein Csc2 n=1 Tax=Marininema halotolerans TaxID=1155944 RepID=A0A1I6SDV1_9BACL|nr:type I-D CRISPR-associated protein Cas7/Csc2 [Marininema halotolerans]SFS75083.1 CRISPR-associated protein Csc2 [Marininema halotolerans]
MKTLTMTWQDSVAKEMLDQHLVKEIPLSPQRNYASMIVLRECHSTAVLTTEGTVLDVELVRSGEEQEDLISRVVLQKRKQVAPERRTGRAFNRQLEVGEKCDYMNEMCGKCPDCLIYGFAASKGEGAQRARVMTDSGFAIRSYDGMQRSITLNAIKDTSAGGVAGSAFAEREHIRPQVFFPTVESTVDVTSAEFMYILRNILTTTRYGAESNRQGYVKNHLVAVLFGSGELLSNLSLTQKVYDRLYAKTGDKIHEFPLSLSEVTEATHSAMNDALEESYLPFDRLVGEDLNKFLGNVRDLWKSEEGNQLWQEQLKSDQQEYISNRK